MSATTRWAARARLAVARHPSLRRAALVACAGAAAWGTAATLAAPAHERAVWGTTAAAWVATRDLSPGEPVAARRVDVPLVLLPDHAVRSLDTPGAADGPAAAGPIAAGEILVDDDIAGRGRWALVPAGWRAVAVERHPATLAVRPGDRVDLYSAQGRLATGAVVAATDDRSITVAVEAGDAPATATAVDDPSLVLVLVSGDR
jgi:hypothetical protein